MKALISAALVAASLCAPASAAMHPRGWTPPSPFTLFTPPNVNPAPHHGPAPAPIPAPSSLVHGCAISDTKCTMKAVIDDRLGLIAGLTETDTTQAAVINPASGEAWDPYLHMCLMGTPASGTPGQPGYVAPEGGLIAWIQGLQQPTVASVPPLPPNPQPSTVAEHLRLIAIAGEQDVNTLVAIIQAGGFPASVKQPCAGFLQDAFVTQPATIAVQVAVISKLLLTYLPK